jgi:hypothetical protein
MMSLRRALWATAAAALGVANAVLPRILLGSEFYLVALFHFAIWVLLPVILLGFVGSRVIPPSRFNTILARGSILVAFMGLFAGAIALAAIEAHVMIPRGVRECIGVVCFLGVGAAASALRALGSMRFGVLRESRCP